MNWIGAITDTAGADTYYTNQREGRSQEAIQYTTPDLNGFAGAIRFSLGDGTGSGARGNPDETLNLWNLAAKYEVAGFHVAGSYNVIPGGLPLAPVRLRGWLMLEPLPNPIQVGRLSSLAQRLAFVPLPRHCQRHNGCAVTATTSRDTKSWNLGLKYAQDNWFVGGVYGVDNTSEDKLGIAMGDGMTDVRRCQNHSQRLRCAQPGCWQVRRHQAARSFRWRDA